MRMNNMRLMFDVAMVLCRVQPKTKLASSLK
jgi:hypothetical protein